MMSQTIINRDHNKKIFKIIQSLISNQQSNHFRRPLPYKSLGWDDYREVIKKPLDLNLIRRQYNEGKYRFVQQVLSDIQLIWDNVFIYGRKEHQTWDNAVKMHIYYHKLIQEYYPEMKEEIVKNSLENVERERNKVGQGNKHHNVKQIHGEKRRAVTQNNNKISTTNTTNNKIINNKNEQKSFKQYNNTQQHKIQNQLNNNQIQTKRQSNHSRKKQSQINKKSISIINNQPIQVQKPVINNDKKQNKINENVGQIKKQSQNHLQMIVAEQPIEQQDQSLQNLYPPPILVHLRQQPTTEQLTELTSMMRQLYKLSELQTLSKIIKILTQYQKENMMIDGDEVNFRMNQIHISTYWRIKKQLEGKMGVKINGMTNNVTQQSKQISENHQHNNNVMRMVMEDEKAQV